jgi:cytochrome c oxidase cbb3-type subunit 1
LLAQVGRTPLAQPLLVLIGGKIWNLGITVGILSILAGQGTGFENFEMPRYAASILFLGYVLIALMGMVTFHTRRERPLVVSHWFLVSALFWFPWVYSTAGLLLLGMPARGVEQSVIAWWYSNNLTVVWFGLVGLAFIFYFVPKLAARDLHSRDLAGVAFWTLVLFGSWGGVPSSAPVPAWIPSLSTVGTLLTIFTVLAVGLNFHHTLQKQWSRLMASPALAFIGFGLVAFLAAGVMNVVSAPIVVNQVLAFTWFGPALAFLQTYGFFAMVLFGSVYHIVPQLMGIEFPSPKWVCAHFRVAAAGILLIVLPLLLGGLVEGLRFQNPNVPFLDLSKTTLMFLRISTLGELALLLGHVIFVMNLVGIANRFYKTRALAAYAAVTAQPEVAGVRA